MAVGVQGAGHEEGERLCYHPHGGVVRHVVIGHDAECELVERRAEMRSPGTMTPGAVTGVMALLLAELSTGLGDMAMMDGGAVAAAGMMLLLSRCASRFSGAYQRR